MIQMTRVHLKAAMPLAGIRTKVNLSMKLLVPQDEAPLLCVLFGV